jgi:hypothetical protein
MPRMPAAVPCPSCGTILDAASPATDVHATPEAGDASVCFYCGVFLIFTSDEGTYRLATQSEVDEVLRENPELHPMVQAIIRRAKIRPAKDS